MAQAISSRKTQLPTGCLIGFFAIFAVAGIAALTFSLVLPMSKVLQARSWTPTACVINSSNVVGRGSGEDRSYFPEVEYSYAVNGTSYRSRELSFFQVRRKNAAAAAEVLSPYPAGATVECYVHPADPGQAMLDRSVPPDAWTGLLSLIFVAVGVGGIVWQVKAVRDDRSNVAHAQTGWQPAGAYEYVPAARPHPSTSVAAPLHTTGEVELKPKTTRIAGCFGLTLFSLIWNGGVAIFVWKVLLDSGAGFFRIFVGLFLIPFAIVGLIVLVAAVGSFLSFFSSSLRLTMNRRGVAPGEEFVLAWKMQPRRFSPKKLTIVIEAREEATYVRGTDSHTDKSTFYLRELVETTQREAIQQGAITVQIPADMMHSFEARNNKIIWALKVDGDISLWPNIQDEYTIFVTP